MQGHAEHDEIQVDILFFHLQQPETLQSQFQQNNVEISALAVLQQV